LRRELLVGAENCISSDLFGGNAGPHFVMPEDKTTSSPRVDFGAFDAVFRLSRARTARNCSLAQHVSTRSTLRDA
jgi:hypothetical protein